MRRHRAYGRPKAQAGTAAVEFAFVSIALFTLLIGITEFGRVLFYWNSAEEAAWVGTDIATAIPKAMAARTLFLVIRICALPCCDLRRRRHRPH